MTKPNKSAPSAPKLETKTGDVTIIVPVLDTGFPLLSRIDLRLSERQARALRLVFDGLQAEGEECVVTGDRSVPLRMPGDAIRFMLDQIADAVEHDAA